MNKKTSKKQQSSGNIKELKKTVYYKELIADLIFECRAHAGKNQTEFGKLIGTNQTGVARLESGDHFPRIETLVKIAVALNCDLVPPKFNFVKKSFFDSSMLSSIQMDYSSFSAEDKSLILKMSVLNPLQSLKTEINQPTYA